MQLGGPCTFSHPTNNISIDNALGTIFTCGLKRGYQKFNPRKVT